LAAATKGLRVTARALVVFVLALLPSCAQPQDYAREERWASEVLPALVVGEAIRLPTGGGHRFLGLLTEAPAARTAVVLVHGMGVHPDHGVIGKLRQSLADAGYTTLSIQMPVLASDAKEEAYPPLFPEAGERIAAALRYLQEKRYASIVLLSHSMGSRMSNAWLVKQEKPGYAAWVCLGRSGPLDDAGKLHLPVLDVRGEDDLPAVRQHAAARGAALAKLANGSEQKVIAGADHFYTGRESGLTDAIVAFIKRTGQR
jgi:alpha-beta hydrolase superfamily lysophospholipase